MANRHPHIRFAASPDLPQEASPETPAPVAAAPVPLPPLLDPVIAAWLARAPQQLHRAVAEHGSPLNIVWPHALTDNVRAIRLALQAYPIRHALFYGAKVNKSQALVAGAVQAGAGVDVSSLYEWRDARRAGAEPAQVCATGPAKTARFHAELVRDGALVSVDSVQEFDALAAIAHAQPSPRPVRVLLRYRPDSAMRSRFGMDGEALAHCLRRCAQERDTWAFEGFHFHLSGYDWEARAQALRELMPYLDMATSAGLSPRIVDIGGGLPTRYVASDFYDRHLRSQHPAHYRNGRVPASFYPYGDRTDAAAWLHSLLGAPCTDGAQVWQVLRDRGLTLAVEPGRSLVDQAAITVFRVTHTKPLAQDHVVLVEGSSFSACETWFASEFLVDPVLVPCQPDAQANGPVRAYIAGHSCLDDDVITNRLLPFSRLPQPDDLLVYANTAGYQMDLLENEFHRHPMPRRLVATSDAAGNVGFSPDN